MAAVTLLAGCASAPIDPRVRYEAGLDKDVLVTRIAEAHVHDGTLRVGVSGVSLTKDYAQVLRYRFNWYDRADLPISTSVANWERLDVDPQGTFEFVGVGPGPRGVRYLVEFRHQ
jgi:uncharacterized protein YcfL